jgi:uncharacterized protein
VVTQTRVRSGCFGAFARWQDKTSAAVAAFPGFIQQTVIPPTPPGQLDWVILQRFTDTAAAAARLNSDERLLRVQGAAPMLLGRDDVHIINDGGTGVLPAPVSVVISTRIKAWPGRRLPGLGAAHCRRPSQGAGLPGLSLQAAGAGRAG